MSALDRWRGELPRAVLDELEELEERRRADLRGPRRRWSGAATAASFAAGTACFLAAAGAPALVILGMIFFVGAAYSYAAAE